MTIEGIYKRKFRDLLQVEEKARDLYGYYASRIEDPSLKALFAALYEDEKRHAAVVGSFLDCFEKQA